MIQTNILYRTFFIRAAQYGTAFTLEVNDEEFLITARHLIPSYGDEMELQIFHENQWLNGKARVVGRGRGEIDIAVLKIDVRLGEGIHRYSLHWAPDDWARRLLSWFSLQDVGRWRVAYGR